MYEPYLAEALMDDRRREAAAIHRGEATRPASRRRRGTSTASLLGAAEASARFNRRHLNF